MSIKIVSFFYIKYCCCGH